MVKNDDDDLLERTNHRSRSNPQGACFATGRKTDNSAEELDLYRLESAGEEFLFAIPRKVQPASSMEVRRSRHGKNARSDFPRRHRRPMISAVDSNVLIDLLGAPTKFAEPATSALDICRRQGALIICPVVIAETAAYFGSPEAMREMFQAMHLELRAFDWQDLWRAGEAYVNYCRRSRAPKPRMLADFLVAAHAFAHADVLLTRDRGYYRTYFPKLALIEP
jgi:predicted nucleic acid-binding protein